MIPIPRGCMGLDPHTVRGPCAAGIDIRPGSWDVVVGDLVNSTVTGVRVTRPVFIGKVMDEEHVLFILKQYGVRFAVADTRPETTLAKRLQVSARAIGIRFWRAEYNTAPSTVEISENENEGLLKIDRTMTLDSVHYAFMTGLTVVLPQNFREVNKGDFAREMCSSSRVPVKWLGRDAYSWENSGPDHAFHAWNLMMVAIRKSNLLAFGNELTMGATRGIVESTLNRNVTGIETGVKTDRVAVADDVGINWQKIFSDEDGDEAFLEV